MEEIEYVYGKNRYGKIKAVIIPIDLWKKIKATFFDPSEFRGLHHDLLLVTKNKKDFKEIERLEIYNPFKKL